uniref:ATP synthase F1 subunit 4 n=1 Tax=Gredgaria maugeana TaxID=2007213 RepID=UPI0022FD5DB8|nr:ATP synthase F1 subunit 4 [Gredgaria maugeana]WAX04207.1 ATP synthase F1 subunit 4 [Gredgaria maugeana]
MKFLFSFIILFVVIITNKLFLFNEEFLILLSFFSFCFVLSEQLSPLINFRFEKKISLIKISLIDSLKLIHIQFSQKKKLNTNLKKLNTNLKKLKNHYENFTLDFLTQFICYLKINEKYNFLNKFLYLVQLENDYLKLIVSLLIKKINSTNNLIKFFGMKLKIKRFQTFYFINQIFLIKKI